MFIGLDTFGKNLFFADSASRRLLFGVCLGVSFSISVILATIGIMDGFDLTLKKGLHMAEGDVFIYSRFGTFDFDNTEGLSGAKSLLSNSPEKETENTKKVEVITLDSFTNKTVIASLFRRSNPELYLLTLDCRVASAPRNDKFFNIANTAQFCFFEMCVGLRLRL